MRPWWSMSLKLAPKTIARGAISSNILKFRYPISASDVLSSDSQAPIEFFFPDKPLYVTEEVQLEKETVPEQK